MEVEVVGAVLAVAEATANGHQMWCLHQRRGLGDDGPVYDMFCTAPAYCLVYPDKNQVEEEEWEMIQSQRPLHLSTEPKFVSLYDLCIRQVSLRRPMMPWTLNGGTTRLQPSL